VFSVRAHEPLNHTELLVSPGETYSFQPQKGRWVDWFIPSGPAGYHTPWTDRFKSKLRNPRAPFFALIVTVGDDLPPITFLDESDPTSIEWCCSKTPNQPTEAAHYEA
jgi:hypothetical protein